MKNVINTDSREVVFNEVSRLTITKTEGGYRITIGKKNIDLEGITNFDWRVEGSVKIKHMYVGNETIDAEAWQVNVEFAEPYEVLVQMQYPRCYVYVKNLHH